MVGERGGIGAQHDEFTLGQVDDTHHPEDHGKAEADQDEDAEGDYSAEEENDQTLGTGSRRAAFSGKITNRTDVLRALDEICAYYRRSEPSSPVPLLLGRARRLVDLDFYSIIKDLAPDGEAQVLNISGQPPGEGEDETSNY